MIPADQFFFGHQPTDAEKARFFAGIYLPNGTFKTTAVGRMNDLDFLIAEILCKEPSTEMVRLLDVGVSSGITSHELVETLKKHEICVCLLGIDQYIHAKIIRLTRLFSVLCDSRGSILQFIIGRYGIKNFSGLRDTKLGQRIVLSLIKEYFRVFLAQKYRDSLADTENGNVRPLMFLDPSAASDPSLTFIEDDLFSLSQVDGAFDIIRAANILNLDYFSEDDLVKAGQGLAAILKIRGLLVLCRTDKSGRNHGGIYRKISETAFERQVTIGEGSEIDGLVDRFLTETPVNQGSQ